MRRTLASLAGLLMALHFALPAGAYCTLYLYQWIHNNVVVAEWYSWEDCVPLPEEGGGGGGGGGNGVFDADSRPLTEDELCRAIEALVLAVDQVSWIGLCGDLFLPYGVPGSTVLSGVEFRYGNCENHGQPGKWGYAHVGAWSSGYCVIYLCAPFFATSHLGHQAEIVIHETLHLVGASHPGSDSFPFLIQELCQLY